MATAIDVIAVMDDARDVLTALGSPGTADGVEEARAAVASQQELLRRLVAWNRNPNGDGLELQALLASAESLVGYDPDAGHPRHDYREIPAVAELVESHARLLRLCESARLPKAAEDMMPMVEARRIAANFADGAK